MSTLEQLKGDSRRRQFARAQRYAEENGLEIVDRFDDWGVSAFRGRNSEFGALNIFKQRLDAGEIERGSYLIVESMDRLSRQKVMKALTLLTDIVSKGVILVTLDDNQTYSEKTIEDNSFNLIIALASMSRAHEESRRKSGLVADAWCEKKRLARESGVLATKKVPGWLTVRDGHIEVLPERAEVVREIFTLMRGGWGAFSICRRLNERNEPVWSTRKNAVWRESYIKKILKSRTVLGEYQPHRISYNERGDKIRTPDGDAILNYYPRVVSKELFQEANAATGRRRIVGRGRKGSQYTNLFSGLLRCTCGAGYRFINKGEPPKGGKYLQCSVSFQGGQCRIKAFRYDLVEELLLRFIEALDIDRVLGGQRRNERLAGERARLLELTEAKSGIESSLKRIVAAIASDDEAPSRVLTVEVRRLELELERVNAETSRVETQIAELLQVDPEKRRQVMDELLSKLQDESAPDSDVTRRALVAELQRMLHRVIVRPNVRVAFELADSDPDWKSTYGVKSMAGLERLCRERSFELIVVYQNGDSLVVDAMDGPSFWAKGNVQYKNWTYLDDQHPKETRGMEMPSDA